MTSYKGLLNKIEAFCNAHLQIKKYGGEFKEQMPNFSTENEKYPIVYIVPTSDISDLNTNQFTLDIYCVDIIQKDRANINTIISDCNLILNDLYLYFLDGNDLTIDVIGASNGSPLNNFDLDYSAGWVKSITFEVQAYSVCAIPMNPISPNPPVVCNPATYNLIDTLDNVLSSGTINSGSFAEIVVGDSTVENSDATYSETILAEGTLVLPDITVNVINSVSTIVNTTTAPSVQDVTISAPNGTVHIKKFGDGTITNVHTPSGVTTEYSVADNSITVNGTNGFSIDATDPLDIVLKDTTNATITPTSVTYSQGQHKVDIVLPAPVAPIGARLMKTGQTVSYQTGDDGTHQAGRLTSFSVLGSNNPFGNTNRFTDELGGQTYTKGIMIDWAQASGNTVQGYYFNSNTSRTWSAFITWANALSITGFTSGWRPVNKLEIETLFNYGASTFAMNYAPLNNKFIINGGADRYFWASNTYPNATNSVWYTDTYNWNFNITGKAGSTMGFAIRTFTVTGTTLS
jgi:hypothetical protein